MFKCMHMYEGGAKKVHYKKEKEAEFEAVKGASRHACLPWTRKPWSERSGVSLAATNTISRFKLRASHFSLVKFDLTAYKMQGGLP